MYSLLIAAGVFVGLLLSAWLGMKARGLLPQHHLSADSQDAIKLGMGLIATMAALVLGLLIASAKNSFDNQNNEMRQVVANLLELDRLLGVYGPEAAEARALLRASVEDVVNKTWRRGSSQKTVFDSSATTTTALAIFAKITALAPRDDLHQAIKDQAIDLIKTAAKARWQLVAEEGSSIPVPFLAVLVFWLSILFASFGLFAPRNATVLAAFAVCAMSVAGAIFLILELDRPFEGLMKISSEPFRKVLER
jgi:Protein of unknown function (DUF4239)